MSARGVEDRESFQRRVEIAGILVAVAFSAMVGAYWYVQIVRGDYYFGLSENNRLRSVAVTAARGVVHERNGAVVAENEPAFSLLLYRRETRDLAGSLSEATEILGLSRDEVDRRVARYRTYFDFVPIDLADNLTLGEVAAVEARGPEHPEFAIGVGQRRRYPHGAFASQAIGYLSEVSPEQIVSTPDRFRPGDLIGQRGVEGAYQDILAGRDGERRIIVDSFGHETAEESRIDPVPGRNLTLTIDARLQQIAETDLAGRAGSVVAMDPSTGEILALASSPGYDANVFSGPMSTADWGEIIGNPLKPLQNRAIQNVYSPGSVFKLFLAEAGLAGGYITKDTRVFCPGSAVFYGRSFRCHKPEGHGWVNLHDALRGSCDVYFYTLGKRMGIERIAEAARAFGFGEPTGLDLPGEKAGLVPSEEWSEKVRRTHWYPSETISVAIGQGPILVSAVQMARGLAGLLEGGRFPHPHLFLRAEDPQSGHRYAYDDPIERRLTIAPDVVSEVEDDLWAVVNEPGGTAYSMRLPGIEFCGKTGSVQVVGQKDTRRESSLPFERRDHAWFVGFAPKRNPRIVVVAFVEHGEHGASAAAPIARDLVAAFFGGDGTAAPNVRTAARTVAAGTGPGAP